MPLTNSLFPVRSTNYDEYKIYIYMKALLEFKGLVCVSGAHPPEQY
jgi:hypothetical protein